MAPTTKSVAKAKKTADKPVVLKKAAKPAASKTAIAAPKPATKRIPTKTAPANKITQVAKKTKVANNVKVAKAANNVKVAKAAVKKRPVAARSLAPKPGAAASRSRVIPALAKRMPFDATRKAPPKRTGPLDKFLLSQLQTLTEERVIYTRQAVSLKAEADQLMADREPGDVQFDEESGEGDTLAVERERDLALSAQAAAAAEEIDLALAKLHDGTYGVCEQCYSNIPRERLRALPYAALCVQCKTAGFSRR